MAFYLDSCVIVSAFVPDANSAAVDNWLRAYGNQPMIASDWTIAELPSSIGRLVRKTQLSTTDGDATWHKMVDWVEKSCAVETVVSGDFRRAAEFQAHWPLGLRAGDSLHMSVAKRLGAHLITADKILARACLHFEIEQSLLQAN
jgi:uncharacterized protein